MYLSLSLVEYTLATSQSVCPFSPGVGGCGQFRTYMGKGRQIWMGQADFAGMGDKSIRWVWVYVQV